MPYYNGDPNRDHDFDMNPYKKGTLMGTLKREPQEYSRNMIGIYLPGSLYSIIFLLYSWGSLFGVPIEVRLYESCALCPRHLGSAFLGSFSLSFTPRKTLPSVWAVVDSGSQKLYH